MNNIYNYQLCLSQEDILKKAKVQEEKIYQNIINEKENIGYYNLPFQDISHINRCAKTVKQNHIAVIGIGGSTLGTYAIYKFLKESKNLTKQLHFFESTDPLDIQSNLKKMDLDDTLFIVVSKSGTTIETISLFKYLHSLTTIDKNNCLIITQEDSKLHNYAKTNLIKTFQIPKNVGGRFSVFSVVGLVPLAIVGIDIKKLLEGAKQIYYNFFSKKDIYKRLFSKARDFTKNRAKRNINVLFSYSSQLAGFNKWYIQLWAESLGKISANESFEGLTPVGLLGPADQHSFLQLIAQGKRDKTVTVIRIKNFNNNKTIPNIDLDNLDSLDYVNNIDFSQLINYQADATIQSIKKLEDIPVDVIDIKNIDEQSIAKLIYEYKLLTSITGQYLNINTYDQPGVESGKTILKKTIQGK